LYPAIELLLPHRPPMLLLTAVGLHAGDLLIARSERRLLDALLPTSPGQRLLSLELMAQAAAVYASLSAAAVAPAAGNARAAAPGMLLGSRVLEDNSAVALQERLLVGVIRRTPLTGAGLAKFSGRVWSGADDALEQALEKAKALTATITAAASIVTAVEECTGVNRLAAADVSVYLPEGEI
jgi:predicted hotdog family 3-hydroxylacyl-ACP dehydratase